MTRSDDYLDDAFLHRVKAAYQKALPNGARKSKIWNAAEELQRPIHEALLAENCGALRRIFKDPIATDLFYGVDNLSKSILGQIYKNKDVVDSLSSDARWNLSAIAEQLNAKNEPGAILRTLDGILRHRIVFPNPFQGEVGFDTSRGIASYRAIQALYQAYKTIALLGDKPKPVIEIGPGMGRGAYYCYRAGVTDYTTIDIPLGVVRQACFLGAALGPDRVWFEGENASDQLGRIRLMNSGSFPARQFDVAINVDSMTEVPRSSAVSYTRWMNRHVGVFFSINHEENLFTVTNLANSALNFHKHAKKVCPARPNYAEEVFFIDSSATLIRRLQLRLKHATYQSAYLTSRLMRGIVNRLG